MSVPVYLGFVLSMAICSAVLIGTSQPAQAKARQVIFVAPDGRPDAPGTREMPLGHIQDALDRATPGTTVKVLPGVYRERVAFHSDGTQENPIILEGSLGAIIDGSEDFTPQWEPAPDVADGAFRAHNVPFNPVTVVANGRIVNSLNESRVTPPRATEPEWLWQNLFSNGISGWDGVKALALYRPGQEELLVRFYPGIDPTQLNIKLAPREPVVAIHGVDHVVVRGLALRNAWYGVEVTNSTGAVIEYCDIGPTDHGVWLGPGSQQSIVRYNDIAHYPYGDVSTRALSWTNWLAHKNGGYYDRVGVEIRDSIGYHEVHDNYIHDHFDGIEDKTSEDPELSQRYNKGLKIHHNLVVNIMDDGLEPNGSEIDAEWHDNVVINAICGIRVKRPTHGPLYIYRNIFLQNSEGVRFYGEFDMLPAKVFLYHNTSASYAALTSNKVFGIGTPNYFVYNNLFYANRWWSNTGDSVEPNWTGDYNAFVQRDVNAAWPDKAPSEKRGIDTNSKWIIGSYSGFIDGEHDNLTLTADSPARGAGTDLSLLFPEVLPGGYSREYYKSNTSDAGALPYGTPMPNLPRQSAVKLVVNTTKEPSAQVFIEVPVEFTPNRIDTVRLALDGNLYWEGTQLPLNLSIDLLTLAAGPHQLALEVSGDDGLYGKAVARFSVIREVQLQLFESDSIAGVVPIRFNTPGLPPDYVSSVQVSMNRTNEHTAALDVRSLYDGIRLPADLEWDTTQFNDGFYELTVNVRTTDGQVFAATNKVSVQNWQQLVDDIKPPLDSGWLGVYDNSKTCDKSNGWEYATDHVQEFFADSSRLVRRANTEEYLTWNLPNLAKFSLHIYTTNPLVKDALVLEVSTDQQHWYRPYYEAKSLATNELGRWQIEFTGMLPQGTAAQFLRLTLLEGTQPPEDIQVGMVTLTARVVAKDRS